MEESGEVWPAGAVPARVGISRQCSVMIPTKFKSKLPKALCYPIGAEAISAALAGAPHATEFSLNFYDQAVWPAAEFNRLVREGLPYRILYAAYKPTNKPGISASRTSVANGLYQEQWSLTVYPVLRELRQAAAQLLRDQGLPAVVEWLRTSGRPGWNTRSHVITLVFDPSDRSLAVIHKEDA